MTISLEMAEFLKHILPDIVFIAALTLSAIGLIFCIIGLVQSNKHQSKRITKALLDEFVIFTKEEWANFTDKTADICSDILVKKFDIYPKGTDFRNKLCDSWCNEDDTIRYYITNHGGYFVLFEEDRRTKNYQYKTYMLRYASTNPNDKYLFFADGPNMQTISVGYNPDEDMIFIPDNDVILERVKSYYGNQSPESMVREVKISEVEFADN